MKKIILGSCVLAASLFAGNNTNTGCGLGSVLIEDQSSTLMQLVATSLNGTSGNQTFVEANNHVPFDIKRAHWIYDVPGGAVRGGHAYKKNKEFMECKTSR